MNLWRILYRYAGWRLALAAAAGATGGAALAALMRLIHRALTLPAAEISAMGWTFLALIAAYFVATVTAQQSLNDAAERLQWELKTNLLRQVLALPLRQLERIGETRLFELVGHSVGSIAEYLCSLPDVAVNAAIAIGCFGYMAWLSPPVMAFNLIFIAVVAACYVLPQRAARRLGRAAADAGDRHAWELLYALRSAKSLQLNRDRRRTFFATHLIVTAAKVRALTRRSRWLHLLSERLGEALVLANVGFLLFVLPHFIHLPIATSTGLLLAAVFVRQPLKDSINVLPRTQRVRIDLSRIEEAGLRPFEVPPEEPAALTELARFAELALEAVTFRYDSEPPSAAGFAAGPFSLRIKAAEIVFITGGNGAGKTTLAKLLCGLYPPSAGRVWLDGEPIATTADRERLRERFAAVFSDDPLFDHVLGSTPEAAQREGSTLVAEFQLGHKVALEGTRFTTTDLSQGQRRRLNLLGALLDNRPILLLDEWAADQDPQFRRFFYEQLLPAFRARGKTLILITHDDRYFGSADRVLKLDNGEVVANDTATGIARSDDFGAAFSAGNTT